MTEVRPERGPNGTGMSARATWIWVGVLVASVAVFAKCWDAVSELGTTVHADRSIVDFVEAHRTGWLTGLARAWTLMGSAWIVVPVVTVAVVALVARRRLSAALLIATSSAGCAIAVALLKPWVARPRPPVSGRLAAALGAAFPSGHAAQSVACYAALAWIVTTQVRSRSTRIVVWSVAVVIALGVGWSRVFLGVHWPSDVVAGWALATTWLAILVLAELLASVSARSWARSFERRRLNP